MKPIQGDIRKLIRIRNDPEFNNEKKFEDLNKKLNNMIEEIDIMKSTNKEWDSKIINYKQTNNSSELLNSKNNSKYKVVNKSNKEFNNYNFSMNSPSREAKNSSKNLLMSYENDAKKASINNSGLPKLNNELGSPQKSTFSKNQKEKGETKYNNDENNNNLKKKILFRRKS